MKARSRFRPQEGTCVVAKTRTVSRTIHRVTQEKGWAWVEQGERIWVEKIVAAGVFHQRESVVWIHKEDWLAHLPAEVFAAGPSALELLAEQAETA